MVPSVTELAQRDILATFEGMPNLDPRTTWGGGPFASSVFGWNEYSSGMSRQQIAIIGIATGEACLATASAFPTSPFAGDVGLVECATAIANLSTAYHNFLQSSTIDFISDMLSRGMNWLWQRIAAEGDPLIPAPDPIQPINFLEGASEEGGKFILNLQDSLKGDRVLILDPTTSTGIFTSVENQDIYFDYTKLFLIANNINNSIE